MAYKFQLGSAVLSGSINVAAGAISGSAVSDTLAASIVSEIDDGEIPLAKLAEKTISGKDLGTNLDSLSSATNGGVTFTSYNGSSAVNDLKLDITDLADGSIADGDFIVFADANDSGNNKVEAIADVATLFAGDGLAASNSALSVQVSGALKVASDKVGLTGSIAGDGLSFEGGVDSISKLVLDANPDSFDVGGSGLSLASNVAGDGLALSSGVLSVGVDDSSIELNSDALRVKASGVTNAMLAGSIANAKLANSSITVGGSGVSLGGTITGANIAAALNSDLGGNFTIGNQSSDTATFTGGVTVAGNLTVQGTTTSIDSTTINISSSFTFEGPADDFETTLSVGTPIQDIDILMPEYSSSAGSHQVKMALLASGDTAANYLAASLVTAAEFKILDGGTADSSVTILDADKFIVNDGGVMKQTAMSDLKDYIGTPSLTVTSGSASSTLAVGMNFFNNHGGAISATCPASAALSNGDIIRIKAGPDCSATNSLTINRAGSQTFDATETSIKLESPHAAVMLVYVDTDDFRIM